MNVTQIWRIIDFYSNRISFLLALYPQLMIILYAKKHAGMAVNKQSDQNIRLIGLIK